ncbi:MAG TPA: hypothetical protein VM938_07205 [Acidimicrobiales bacterium]|nr:hypothetical protein [Acidimicrobiales bacterium]
MPERKQPALPGHYFAVNLVVVLVVSLLLPDDWSLVTQLIVGVPIAVGVGIALLVLIRRRAQTGETGAALRRQR